MNKLAPIAALAAAASLYASPVVAQDSPVLGKWETAAETPMGNFESTWTFAQEADGYTIEIVDAPMPGPGGAEAPEMESSVSDVMVEGSEFSFRRNLTTPQGPMELTYSGSVTGDEMSAEANSSFGAIPITGTRAE